MKSIAFVFKTAPHGTSSGREGLDALLSAVNLIQDVGVFFISDGIFQILVKQDPKVVLSRDYIITFKTLPLYGIKKFILCGSSLHERGLNKNSKFILDVVILDCDELHKELAQYDIILSF